MTLIREWASFTGDRTIKTGDDEISGKHIYINTGTRPFAPPLEGIDNVPWMDSAGLLDLDHLPEELIIIGGGYIGMEFAQVYSRFGSKVTVLQRGIQVMPNEDEDIAVAIKEMLENEGIEIRCNAEARSVEYENGRYSIRIENNGAEENISGTDLLIAAGRKPNSDKLGLENTSIKINSSGYIDVDDHCQTAVDGVFAVGDVNGHGAFTHTSVNDAEIVLDFLNGGSRTVSQRIPIYALFTDPPLGRVGMTEKEALAKNHRIYKATKPMSEISRAKEMGETTGFAKLIVDQDSDLILGVAILGPGGDEIINMFGAIMHSGISCRSYREAVLVHPTVSELMPFVLDGLEPV